MAAPVPVRVPLLAGVAMVSAYDALDNVGSRVAPSVGVSAVARGVGAQGLGSGRVRCWGGGAGGGAGAWSSLEAVVGKRRGVVVAAVAPEAAAAAVVDGPVAGGSVDRRGRRLLPLPVGLPNGPAAFSSAG